MSNRWDFDGEPLDAEEEAALRYLRAILRSGPASRELIPQSLRRPQGSPIKR